MTDSPHHAALAEAVAALYALAPERVSAGLEVCLCPVCMTAETRAAIIATPPRDLPPELIRDYSNSAHGVPRNRDDLRSLLPRYLDLLAQDQMVDALGVSTELLPFGQARAEDTALFPPAWQAALCAWARAAIAHFAHLEATGQDHDMPLAHLTEVLLVGGWPEAEVFAALEASFAAPEAGPAALAGFLAGMAAALRDGQFNLYALASYRAEVIPALADWLRGLILSPAGQAALATPTEDLAPWAPTLTTMAPGLSERDFKGNEEG